MNESEEIAVLVRHRAKPGQRDQVLRVWEKYVKPRAESNPAHLHYHFCFDNADPDVVIAFQVYRNQQTLDEFLGGEWYPDYLREISEYVSAEPEVASATVVWSKGSVPLD